MASEIKSITFLTTAIVTISGEDPEENEVKVDMVNRKIYGRNGIQWDEAMTDKFFAHIQESTKLPDDLFSAPHDALEAAQKSQAEHAAMRGQQIEE